MKQGINTGGVTAWLSARLGEKRLSPRQDQVLAVLRAQPRLASYSSVTDVAQAAGSNASTVTRTAQALGYDGWAEFQVEFRSRYLSSLSAVEVAAEHEAAAQDPCRLAISTDQANLAYLGRSVDADLLHRVADAIVRARRTWVIAGGSYAVPGRALEHNVGIAGYDIRLLDADVAGLANSIARLTQDDVVVIFSLWRVYDSTVRAAAIAAAAGAAVVVITDDEASEVTKDATIVVVVPSEGAGFFPSLVPSLALAQAIAVEVASRDVEHSRASIAASEASWDALRIMRKRR
ncbi:transcriptional regulator, RpiR family [Agreia bicolorata]|uniref:Silent information regulator protein Sir2 n=1 Tax=Agreia bicolorata TaxID=110935 RepID=A0A1T4WS20_9MICO|nr:MurR/RpiR family transcriptional regulator [Agreia bicolorata]KJC64234.1 silent information regulator protein Sir2 [Agreia bicolorata]SKA80172.1 transcriptional regulator, RpiR family [Agreia bicolorata]